MKSYAMPLPSYPVLGRRRMVNFQGGCHFCNFWNVIFRPRSEIFRVLLSSPRLACVLILIAGVGVVRVGGSDLRVCVWRACVWLVGWLVPG